MIRGRASGYEHSGRDAVDEHGTWRIGHPGQDGEGNGAVAEGPGWGRGARG